ncbi:unnamed protein product [Knipowitschia caucasica]
MSRARHLQQLLDELRERERLSKLHNRELLQQFDEAQNTLREVLDHTAVMKMLWREYKNCTGSCPRCHHLLNQKIHTAEENKNPVTHSQGKPETHQDLSNPLELAYSSKSYSLHSSSPNQTKQPSSGEDNSNSGDLDVKPVRLSSDLTGSEASSRVSMQGSTPKRKGNRISTDEDSSTSHKFSPKDVTTGAMTMASINDHNIAQTFHNKKFKHVLSSKQTKLDDDSSASSKESHESDAEEYSDKLSAHDEPQGNGLNKVAIQKQKEQIASDQSSSQGEAENDHSDVDREKSSQEDDSEILSEGNSKSSLEEEDENRTSESGSSSGPESSECDAVEDRPVKDLKTKSGAEDTDSEDCIVSPKIRSSIIHVIPEHVGQTEESQQTSTDEDSKSSSEEEDIEDVLEPREKTEKQREPNTDEKSKGPCETLIKQSVKNGEINHHSDSNESDDFYD